MSAVAEAIGIAGRTCQRCATGHRRGREGDRRCPMPSPLPTSAC